MAIQKLRGLVFAGAMLVSSCALAQVKQDLGTAGHDTKEAGVATGHATKVGAKKTAHGTKVVAKKTAHGTKVAAKDTGHAVKTGAVATKNGTEKLGDKITGK